MVVDGAEEVVVVVVVVVLVVSCLCRQGFAVISSGWKTCEMSSGIQLLMFARPIVDSS